MAPKRDAASRWRRRWSAWATYGAATWTLLYAGLAVYWALGGAGFPFGAEADAAAHLSVLGPARPEVAAPILAVTCFVAMAVALAMVHGGGDRAARLGMLVFGWSLALGLAVIVPDFRVLVLVAYAPILLIGAPFGWPPDARFFEAVPWPVLNQGVCMAGGLLWAAATLAWQRRTRGACVHCGRSNGGGWSKEDAVRRGRRAVIVAVVIPLVYAATRWAWALGFPLGITDAFYQEGRAVGLWRMGAALATLAVAGAVLTLGLIRPWGEVFPRWLPVIRGRRVPRPLVIVPAALVALIVTSAGLMFVRMTLLGTFRLGEHRVTLDENFGALAPELLWPLWGGALGVAALAYRYRTRGRCGVCGRE